MSLDHWGYLAVLVGTFFEGETVLFAAAWAAHQGHLALTGVALCAFAGSVTGDQLWFLVGRRLRRGWFARRPHLAGKVQRVEHALARWQDLFIVGFRALYGIRLVASFALGAGSVPWRRFALLNTLGAALWVTAMCAAGYGFGAALRAAGLNGLRRQAWIVGGIVIAAALAGWLGRIRRNGRRGLV